jgi:integrase
VRRPVETKYLHPSELAAFLDVPLPPEQALARDLLVETGVRVSEACGASVGDLHDVGGAYVLRLPVKGRGRRVVDFPISAVLAQAINERLTDAGRMEPGDPILVNRSGERWNRSALSELMMRIGKAAGIDRLRVSAHKLRHTANVVARVSGIDAYTRSRLLGHSNPASLARYDHLVPGELHQARDQQLAALTRYVQAFRQSDESVPALPNSEAEMLDLSRGTETCEQTACSARFAMGRSRR